PRLARARGRHGSRGAPCRARRQRAGRGPRAPAARSRPIGARSGGGASMSESIVSSGAESELELAFEGALRPRSLAEFVGQSKARGQLQLLLQAAELQNRTPDHILLAGPPGLGKTTLAMIVAHEGDRPLRMSS